MAREGPNSGIFVEMEKPPAHVFHAHRFVAASSVFDVILIV
jgi:hypothetical protein